jgi:hypothetical protein
MGCLLLAFSSSDPGFTTQKGQPYQLARSAKASSRLLNQGNVPASILIAVGFIHVL